MSTPDEIFKEEKLAALAQLSAGVSHDFNNVLSVINGFTKIISEKINSGDELDKDTINGYLDKILSSTQRGSNLTKKLQMFSRFRMQEKSIYDAGELLAKEDRLLRAKAPPHVSLIISNSIETLPIECAEDTLSQILEALFDNACQACEGKQGAVLIAIEKDDKRNMILRVQDDGAGMDSKTKERIFDPFFSTKDSHQGLGMSVVYGLANEIGADIDVHSSQGHGTIVTVKIPLSKKPPTRSICSNGYDLDELRLDGYVAMIVDDEPDLVEVLQDSLGKIGLRVIPAFDGNDALMKQEEFDEKIDILLTDIRMPELNGIKLGQLFESLRPSTEIIYMSGCPCSERGGELELPENATFLAKPVNNDNLKRIIYEKISGHHVGPLEDTQWSQNMNQIREA